MKIAVIDDVVPKIFHEKLNIIKSIIVDDNLKCIEKSSNSMTMSNHALNVCAIINKYAPTAEIINIGISDKDSIKANINKLIAGLKYCFNEKIPLVNLSMGSTSLCDDYLLRDIISRMYYNKQIIISAKSNNSFISFPAIYPNVLSVEATELNKSKNSKNCINNNIIRPSIHEIILNGELKYKTPPSNSFAAPFLTAEIFNIINNSSKNINDIYSNFFENNIMISESPSFLLNPKIINNSNKRIDLSVYNNLDVHSITNRNNDYIYLSDNNYLINIKNFRTFVELLEDRHSRIFYIGATNSEIIHIMTNSNNRFFVLPVTEIYCSFNEFSFESENKINVYGPQIDSFKLIKNLTDLFLIDRFSAFSYSDVKLSSIFGLYYFKNINSNIRKKQMINIFKPDIEIIYSSKINSDYEDIVINIDRVHGDLITNLLYKDFKKQILIQNDNDYEKLYEMIINLD